MVCSSMVLRLSRPHALLKFNHHRNIYRNLATVASTSRLQSPGDRLHGFHLDKKQSVPVFNLTAYLLKHEKTGAEYLHLAHEDDPNKVFAISFRTNPPDATGVPHILEHTTLCGSEKYPVRDPFFKMLPRSLSHFMNAYTSSDHTTYPFATTNKQDFNNLLSVYMDSTLHPLLAKNDFRQEGWRLGPSDKGDFEFKGVVYNEMKGYMSNASYLYQIRWHERIAPDLNDSGGDPQKITDLTYDQLKNFHAKNYHPSNSRIYTYSSLPLEEHVEEISKHLDRFTASNADPLVIDPIDLSSGSKSVTVEGPVDPLSPAEQQYRTSISWVFDHEGDLVKRFSLGLMTGLLIDGYGSPTYRALIESGLGQDFSPVTGAMRLGNKMVFSIGVIGADGNNLDKIHKVIADTLISQYQKGFDKHKVDGVLHQMDLGIKHKSANFGMSIMQRILPEWFRGVSPFESLSWQEIIDGFKEKYAQPGYLEKLLEESLLKSNTFTFTMKPNVSYAQNITEDENKRLSEKLNDLYSQSSKDQVHETLLKQENVLNESQSANQDLSCLPTLSVNDIPRTKPAKQIEHSTIGHTKVQWRLAPTNGITYVRLVNILENLPEELQEYIPLFTDSLHRLGTKTMTMEQLEDEIKLKTGGISIGYHSSASPFGVNQWEQGFEIGGYALNDNVPALYELMQKMILETDFDSENAHNNIKELLMSSSSNYVDAIGDSGHSYAKGYAMSGLTPEYRARQRILGISQLYHTMNILGNVPKSIENTIQKLKEIQKFALTLNNKLRVAITCSSESRQSNQSYLENLLTALPKSSSLIITTQNSNNLLNLDYSKGFMKMPFQVSYVGYALPGAAYTYAEGAALSILAQLLTHKHLHREIREKGGAYGAGAASHGLGGVFTMSSYRDPNPDRTVQLMKDSGDWATSYNFSAIDLQEAKLSVFKGLDALVDIQNEGTLQFLSGITAEMQQKRREQLLDVTIEDVRIMAQKYLVNGSKDARFMIIGNKRPSIKEENWTELPKPTQFEI